MLIKFLLSALFDKYLIFYKKFVNIPAKTEEEKDFLTNTMVPTMLVGGFTTVTLGSVVFAGILANFL